MSSFDKHKLDSAWNNCFTKFFMLVGVKHWRFQGEGAGGDRPI